MTPEDVARHEAGHAAACVLLGVPVLLVDTIGDDRYAGQVLHLLDYSDPSDLRKRMLITLAGLIETEADELPKWPLSTTATTDERNLHDTARLLELDAVGYSAVVLDACRLTCSREYRLLHTAITGMCEHIPRFGPDLLDRLHAIAQRHGST